MMSPLKLSVIVCGAAAGLAVAPYLVKQVLPNDTQAQATGNVTVATQAVPQVEGAKLDLPVAGLNHTDEEKQPAVSLSAPAKDNIPPQPELRLASAALPTPAPTVVPPAPTMSAVPSQPEVGLPSLSNTVVASAVMPVPSATPTPAPTPAPTPEIPYRSEVEQAQKYMKELGLSTGKIDGKLGPNTQAAIKDFQGKQGLDKSGDVTPQLLDKLKQSVAALATPTPAPTPEAAPVEEKKAEVADAAETKTEPAEAEPVAAAVDAGDMKISSADDPDTLLVRKTEEKVAATDAKPEHPKDIGPVPTLRNQPDVKKLQAALKDAGTYSGDIDGRWGDLTRAAMREFQEKAGLEVTGKPNKETWVALNSDTVKPEEKVEPATARETAKNSESKAKKTSKSEPVETEAPEETDATEVVVTVNGDGKTKASAAEPMPTPKAVGSLGESRENSDSDANREDVPKVTVSAPVKSKSRSDKPASDLAISQDDQESQVAELKKQIEAARAEIRSVSNDSNLEVKKYAPKTMETVNTMVNRLSSSGDLDPDDTKATIARITEELEKAKKESAKKRADSLVSQVRESYRSLKDTFNDRIKVLSLEDDEQKKQREELTVFVANIDEGFEAMEADLKKDRYEPIFKNGKGFRDTIDEVNRGLAKLYVQDKLEEKSTKSKLSKDEIKEIESLVSKENHLKAAEMLDKAISSTSKKKS